MFTSIYSPTLTVISPGKSACFPISLNTCRDEEDAGAEDDVMPWLVELACGDAQPPHEEQDHTQDGEDTGGSYSTCTHASRQKIVTIIVIGGHADISSLYGTRYEQIQIF